MALERVRVGVKLRPEAVRPLEQLRVDVAASAVHVRVRRSSLEADSSSLNYSFKFDFVLDEHVTTQRLFESCAKSVVEAFAKGRNGTILACEPCLPEELFHA
jgi:hypothetical protein